MAELAGKAINGQSRACVIMPEFPTTLPLDVKIIFDGEVIDVKIMTKKALSISNVTIHSLR